MGVIYFVGDYGKLGHGNCSIQKNPKLITGALSGKNVKCVCAGYRHSAAVTEDGELYTWGEGDYGRLGKLFHVYAYYYLLIVATSEIQHLTQRGKKN